MYTISILTHIKKFFNVNKDYWPKGTIQRHIIDNGGNSKFYYDKIINNVHFICLGLYPGSEEMIFLKKVFKNDMKTVIFFHYNITGPFSEWFPEEDKTNFFNYIRTFSNIQYICVGHQHNSYINTYENKKIISGAGSSSIIFDTDTSEIYFIN